MKNIKIVHSFPEKETKFKEYCELTFKLDEFENSYVPNLTEVKNIGYYDVIVVHYLRAIDIQYLLNHEVTKPIIWFSWGGDIFNHGKFYNKFLLHKTKRLRRKISFNQGFIKGLKQLIKEALPVIVDYSKASKTILSALKIIDYIVPVMPGDYSLIKENYNVSFALHHLNYVNPLVEQEAIDGITGKNILLGNSASYTNNHIEAIDQLSKIDLENRKLIIPLSYGNEDITGYIDEYANNKLGKERVIILKEFIPFFEYNEILNSCEIVIMNHLRQQGVGNIIQSLLNGSHIFLREESTVYQFLLKNGFKVSSFNDTYHLEGLSDDEVFFNRAKAKKVFGAETQHKKLLSLMEKALNQ